MKTARTLALFAVLALFWSCAASALDSFRIRQLYSNKDGSFQYIELEEVRDEAGHDGFRGVVLASTNRQGVRKTLAFPTDLPSAETASIESLRIFRLRVMVMPLSRRWREMISRPS